MAVEKPLVCPVFLLILQTLFYCAQSSLIVPSQPVIVPVGSDVTLPCQLDPVKNIKDQALDWKRHDLTPRYVHIRHDGLDLLFDQNTQFQGRTSLSKHGLQCGDMSLHLRRVRLSDGGTYRCYIPQMDTGADVTLIVVSVSPVSVALTRDHSGSPLLRCESTGWYPEPELDWLDSDGTVLTGAKTEVKRGASEETFSVSSRLSVEQSHGNTLTCRVKQQETRQSREAQLTVKGFLEPDHFTNVDDCSSCAVAWTLFGLGLFLAAAAFVIWKYKIWKSDSKVPVEVKVEKGEESAPLLKSSTTAHGDRQKLNEYQEKCSRIREELEFIEENEKLSGSKQLLSVLKQELFKCVHEMDTNSEEKLKKIDTLKIDTHSRDKKRKEQIQKNEEKVKVFKNIMDQTDTEIKKIEEIIGKTTERKGKLKEELKQMTILLENEKKRLETNVQPQQVSKENEVKVKVVDETVMDDLCDAFGGTRCAQQNPVNSGNQTQTEKVREEQSEKTHPEELRPTAQGALDSYGKTKEQTQTEKISQEQSEDIKAEDKAPTAEGEHDSVKTEDQAETEKISQEQLEDIKAEDKAPTAEGEHDSVKTEDQAETEKDSQEQSEDIKAEDKAPTAEGEHDSVKTEDQAETEKNSRKRSKKTKGEEQGSKAEGEHDSVKTEDQAETEKISQEQLEDIKAEDKAPTAEGEHDSVKTEDQAETEKDSQEQSEDIKAEDKAPTAEGEHDSVKTEDQAETEKNSRKRSKKTKGEEQGSKAEGEHDSVKTEDQAETEKNSRKRRRTRI